MVDKVIIGEVDEEGNKNPYVVSFILKSSQNSNENELTEELEKKNKKQNMKQISIEDKNVLCEIKSFQKLKIFENDDDLFRSKKQLDYIKVKVVAEYNKDISFNIAS